MDLSETKKLIKYIIVKINAPDETMQSRFMQLGFSEKKSIYLKRKAPFFGDPLLFEIGDSQVALTKSEARYIQVSIEDE